MRCRSYEVLVERSEKRKSCESPQRVIGTAWRLPGHSIRAGMHQNGLTDAPLDDSLWAFFSPHPLTSDIPLYFVSLTGNTITTLPAAPPSASWTSPSPRQDGTVPSLRTYRSNVSPPATPPNLLGRLAVSSDFNKPSLLSRLFCQSTRLVSFL